MAISESTLNPDHRNFLTRRAALQRTAIVGTVALPAGGAMALVLPAGAAGVAELTGDVDPGLAWLEAGYQRWQEMRTEMDRLSARTVELVDRARSDRPMLEPEPPIPSELVPYAKDGKVLYGTVPEELKAIGGKHQGALIDWRKAHPALDGHPAYEEAGECEARHEQLDDEAWALRDELLAVPARSPRGLLIKFAIAVQANRIEDIETAIEESDFTDDLRLLAPDLRAMAGRPERWRPFRS
jgi:hypothetical protein